jgi:hypothetical protein
LHKRRPSRIRLDLIGMVFAVDFDDEFLRYTGKVGEEGTDRVLASELDAG